MLYCRDCVAVESILCYYTFSKKVSGWVGSKISFAHMTVTRFSVSDRLMMLCVYVDKILLDEDEQRTLNHKLSILHGYTYNGRMARMNRVFVTVKHFVPCTDQNNYAFDLSQGLYEKITGMVLSVDEVRETLTLQAETEKLVIDFEDILDIDPQNPSLFDDAPDEVW